MYYQVDSEKPRREAEVRFKISQGTSLQTCQGDIPTCPVSIFSQGGSDGFFSLECWWSAVQGPSRQISGLSRHWLAWNGRCGTSTQLPEAGIPSPGRCQSMPWPEPFREQLRLVLSFFCSSFFIHPQGHWVTRALQGRDGRLGDSQTFSPTFLNLLFLHVLMLRHWVYFQLLGKF